VQAVEQAIAADKALAEDVRPWMHGEDTIGRTVEIMKNLYADIARRLGAAADVRSDDVMICLIEVTKENWSFGGGRATYA